MDEQKAEATELEAFQCPSLVGTFWARDSDPFGDANIQRLQTGNGRREISLKQSRGINQLQLENINQGPTLSTEENLPRTS